MKWNFRMSGVFKKLFLLARSLLSKLKEVEPNKPLHHHCSFWAPIIIFGILSSYVGYETNNFALKYLTEPKTTMDALAYPLFILSFALPIVLAVGRFHASAQRAETIRISESTMSFKHYFDHREAFIKYMEGYKQQFASVELSLQSPVTLYEVFYPNASMERFDIARSIKTSEKIEDALSYAHAELLKLEEFSFIMFFTGHFNQFKKLGIHIQYDLDEVAASFKHHDNLDSLYITAPFLHEIDYMLQYADEFDRQYTRLCGNSLDAIERYLRKLENYRDVNRSIVKQLSEIIKEKNENA